MRSKRQKFLFFMHYVHKPRCSPYVNNLLCSPYVNNLLRKLGGVRKSASVTSVESSRAMHINTNCILL